MAFIAALSALTALLAAANAHMIMKQPVPYSVDAIDSGPITAAQFPCKAQNGFRVSTMNQMAVGKPQTLTFSGSAVHGGGSCQLSYTQDTEPTKDSVFKVIKSIEGACPGVDSADQFEFTLPASIPNGKGTFAWTWFARLSGAPEMYMNCAPIDVTGGASDAAGLAALPDMLVANIASTTCKSPTNKDLKFPNPGAALDDSKSTGPEDPTGDCGASSGGTPPDTGDSAPAPPTSPTPTTSPKPTSSAAAGPSTTGVQPQPSTTAAPPSSSSYLSSIIGGVFAPGASSGPSTNATQTKTTLVTITGSPSPPPATASSSPAQPTGVPSSPAESTTCSDNGAVVCNGTTHFGLCNNGRVVWQALAAGTTCSNGSIQKRSVRGRMARPGA